MTISFNLTCSKCSNEITVKIEVKDEIFSGRKIVTCPHCNKDAAEMWANLEEEVIEVRDL